MPDRHAPAEHVETFRFNVNVLLSLDLRVLLVKAIFGLDPPPTLY